MSLTYQGRVFGGREALSDRHQEHRHGQERTDSESDFLARFRGDIKHEQSWKQFGRISLRDSRKIGLENRVHFRRSKNFIRTSLSLDSLSSFKEKKIIALVYVRSEAVLTDAID